MDFDQAVEFLNHLGIKLNINTLLAVLRGIAGGMKWQEALIYIALTEAYAEKVAKESGLDAATVDKVFRALAKAVG